MQCQHAPCTCLVSGRDYCSAECRSRVASAEAGCGCAHPGCGSSPEGNNSLDLEPRAVVSLI